MMQLTSASIFGNQTSFQQRAFSNIRRSCRVLFRIEFHQQTHQHTDVFSIFCLKTVLL